MVSNDWDKGREGAEPEKRGLFAQGCGDGMYIYIPLHMTSTENWVPL